MWVLLRRNNISAITRHNIQSNLKARHRILRKLNLKRKNNDIDMRDIISKVALEIKNPEDF